MTQRVQQQDWNQHCARTQSAELRQQINSRGDVEDHRRRDKIQREDTIQNGFHMSLMVEFGNNKLWRLIGAQPGCLSLT
jgi:hypothetical protein